MKNTRIYSICAFLLIGLFYGCIDTTKNKTASKQLNSAIYYVSPNGTAKNPGTKNAPWSLAKANNSLKSGETAILLDGIYKHTPIAPINSGKENAYIIYRAEHKHKAVFEQMNELPDSLGTVVISLNDKSFIAVEGIMASKVDRWLLSYRSHHITINNCHFTDGLGWSNCRFRYTGDGMRITNNYFSGGTDLLSLDGGKGHFIENNFFGDATHTSLVLLGVQRSVVRNNTLVNRIWRCMEVESQRHEPFQRSMFNVIENNFFGFSPAPSIQYAGNYSIIRRNIFRRSLGGMSWANYLGRAKNPEAWHNEHNRFYNNVIAECGSNEIVLTMIEANKAQGYEVAEIVSKNGFGMEYLTNLFKPAKEGYTNVAYGDNVVVNNIFYQNANILHDKASSTAQISFDWNATPEFGKVFNNNIYSEKPNAEVFYFTDAGLMDPPQKSNTTIKKFQQFYPQDAWNNMEDDPQFENPENSKYQLKTSSSAIDKGIALTEVISQGSGTIIPVKDALFFTNGFGLIDGDVIKINSQELNIISINYDENLITVDQKISWIKGDKVFFNYKNKAPDLGVFESGTVTVIGADSTLTKTNN